MKERLGEKEDIHSNPCHAIRRIPEANTSTIPPAWRRIPRHNEQEHLHQDPEDDSYVPSSEFAAFRADAFPAEANHVESAGHEEIEDCIRVTSQVDNWSPNISEVQISEGGGEASEYRSQKRPRKVALQS